MNKIVKERSLYELRNYINSTYYHNDYKESNESIENLLKSFFKKKDLNVFSKDRNRELVNWRIAMYVVLIRQGYSATKIAKLMNRNHASILNALKSYNDEVNGFGGDTSERAEMIFRYLDRHLKVKNEDVYKLWIENNYPNTTVLKGGSEISLETILKDYEKNMLEQINRL